MRYTSLFPLLLLLPFLLLSSLPRPVHCYSLLPTPSTPPVSINSPRDPSTGRTRFAYVAMHYEGTPRDDEYLLGLRTLIFSLQQSGTSQDILVLLSDNVRPSTRATLQSDGVLLHTVPNLPNPFKQTTSSLRARSYKARFEFTFNKLYLWNLTAYERVLYLDSDNVVLSNPDELFLCGHFCVVFMNPLLFHTGLMVVRPDAATFASLVQRLFSDSSYSHDGADQGFLVAVFDMEDAPLFDVSRAIAGQPSDEPRHRLAIGYNLNQSVRMLPLDPSSPCVLLPSSHLDSRSSPVLPPPPPSLWLCGRFWYYTYFSWDFFRRNDYYYRTFPVPGLSIAYPSNWWMKPWYWYSEAYLHHHWTWQIVRYRLTGYSEWLPVVVTRLLLAVVVQAVTWYLLPLLTALAYSVAPAPFASLRWLVGLSPAYIGNGVGAAAFLAVSVQAFRLIPMTTPTILAYPLYVVLHVSLVWAAYYLWCNVLRGRGGVGGEEARGGWDEVVGWRSFAVFPAMHAFTFHLFHPYWGHFIIKIAALLWTAMLWVGVDAHMFRRAADHLTHPKLT